MATPPIQQLPFPRGNYGFRGENNSEGWTSEIFAGGALVRCRNYELVGRSRLIKRQGSTLYTSTPIVADSAVQGLGIYEWGTSSYVVGCANGALKYLNGSSWSTITGALSITAGQDYKLRFMPFRDGSGDCLVGVLPSTNGLFKWTGSGNATAMSTDGPSYAQDLAEFQGRLWALNTDNGSTILEYSADGDSTTWPLGNYFHCSRSSAGVGLSRHGRSALIVFHKRSTHAVRFDPTAAVPWVTQPVDMNIGCISRDSICYDRGVTYWAGNDGFYRLGAVGGGVQYIGKAMEGLWEGLSNTRREHIYGFATGGARRKIVFLVSDGGQTTHNMALVWWPDYEAWTVFDSQSDALTLNAGVDYIDASGNHITLCGDYSGNVWACWGDESYDTGYRDEGSSEKAVRSELWTGMLDCGTPAVKRLRSVWFDTVASTNKRYTLEVVGLGEQAQAIEEETVGTASATLSETFIFDVSRLGGSDTPTPGRIRASVRARAFQFRLTESNTTAPHALNSMLFRFLVRRNRFTA